jgi:hypothetical protein
MILKIYFYLLFLILPFYIFPDMLVLKNQDVINCKLYNIDKDNIIIKSSKNIFYEIPVNIIDKYINLNNNYFIKIDNFNYNQNLLRFSSDVFYTSDVIDNLNYKLFFFNLNENLNLEPINNLSNITINKYNYYTVETNKYIIFDIKEIANALSKKNKKNSSQLKIDLSLDDIDFYEKYWDIFSKVISNNTENILWGLLEIYSTKEKFLNTIYNDGIKQLTANNKSYLLNQLESEIKKLRIDFYKRSKKIINISEFF